MIKRLSGFLGIFIVMALAMETPLVFVNVPSLVIVLGLTFFALLASGSKIVSLLSLLTRKDVLPDELHDASYTVFMAGRYSMSAGVVGVLIGLVLMLGSMDDPAAIGSGVAVALLTALYGVILKYFIYAPILHRIEAKIQELHKENDTEISDEGQE
jgi:flagellar motor component MotA